MMNELLHKRPKVEPLVTCSNRSSSVTVAGGVKSEKVERVNGDEGRKRKSSVDIIERDR